SGEAQSPNHSSASSTTVVTLTPAPSGRPWRSHHAATLSAVEKKRMLAQGAYGLSHHRPGGYGKWTTRSGRAGRPASTRNTRGSPSAPSRADTMTSHLKVAATPSAHQAQFAHHPRPPSVDTQKDVGVRANGWRLHTRSEPGSRMTPCISESRASA